MGTGWLTRFPATFSSYETACLVYSGTLNIHRRNNEESDWLTRVFFLAWRLVADCSALKAKNNVVFLSVLPVSLAYLMLELL